MLKEYNSDVQRLFLEMMLEDAQSYVRVQNIYNPQNFDKNLRPVAEFIREHSDKFKTLPDRTQIAAATGIKLNPVPDLNDGHFANYYGSQRNQQNQNRTKEKTVFKKDQKLI